MANLIAVPTRRTEMRQTPEVTETLSSLTLRL